MDTSNLTFDSSMYEGAATGALIVPMIFMAIIGILMIIASWRIYQKAGKPGWACLIPIYNIIVFLQIINKPLWWFLMFIIPFVNIIFLIMASVEFLKRFGKPTWHILLVLFFSAIYIPVLAFGKAQYKAEGAAA
jgi:hypothetical protein